jgi:hypothetical protein
MYNMEISIGSYKFRFEILVLIVVVSWIMFGHTLCGCSRVGLREGMEIMTEGLTGNPKKKIASVAKMYKQQFDDSVMTTTEGFVGANNMASGPEFAGAKTPDYIMNPSTWSMPTLTYSPGTTPDAGVQAIWDRPKQPIPLPEGQLDMFATTPFAPECCPNAYSSSMGCACMTVDQYNHLRARGGNNVPYSEY